MQLGSESGAPWGSTRFPLAGPLPKPRAVAVTMPTCRLLVWLKTRGQACTLCCSDEIEDCGKGRSGPTGGGRKKKQAELFQLQTGLQCRSAAGSGSSR